ncbi:MAG TPA: glycosyltransferase family 39 protein [Chitinophagales bacterium]|nr:glycosyltransferase family 39 protein [Chitinophagales bacterium]
MQKHKGIIILLLTLVLVNAGQCFSTELLNDEAYYWLWSKFPAWGYFDHPAMVALFIKAGCALFKNELGVRLLFILANAATVYLLYHIVKPARQGLFILVLLSVTPLMAAGYFAVPDIAVLFFAACFFLAYRTYLDADTIPNALLLGLCMALMLYSKYHGVLTIFFVLLSNIQLLKRKTFYLACVAGALFFAPHMWWQWQNDFPTFRFHLFERSREAYSWLRTAEYIGGQLILAGIPAGLLLLYSAVRYKAKNKFQRALQFQLWGTYAFFLVSSLKGRTEANWTIINTIPLVILSYRFLEANDKPARWLKFMLPVSLLSILAIRVHYGTDLTRRYLGVPSETQHWKAWADTIANHAGNRTVVFLSSYQRASKYAFYSGNSSFTTTEVGMRKSQFNIWPVEDEIQNKEIYVCTYFSYWPARAKAHDEIRTTLTDCEGFVVDSFMSWCKAKVTVPAQPYTATRGQVITMPIKVQLPYPNHPAPNSGSRISYRIYSGKTKLGDYETGVLLSEVMDGAIHDINVKVPDTTGLYQVYVSVKQDDFPPPINSAGVNVNVK